LDPGLKARVTEKLRLAVKAAMRMAIKRLQELGDEGM